MILSNYDLPSVALGIGIGLVATHVINARATEQAINKVGQAAKAVYDSLTCDNVTTFTVTCIGLSVAGSFAIPSIKAIFNQLAE